MADIKFKKEWGVALITPFKEDESVDYEALARLVDYQLQNGTDYLVVLGTTAETPTLTEEEKKDIINLVVTKVNGRIPIVLGVGGNCTRSVVEKLKNDNFDGIDAILSVVPYYNKPSQEGIYQHYKAIAEATTLPIVLYNVPGRTGVNMTAETTLRIAREFKKRDCSQGGFRQYHPDGRYHQEQTGELQCDFRRRRYHLPAYYVGSCSA